MNVFLDVNAFGAQMIGYEADKGNPVRLADARIKVDFQLTCALFDLLHGEAKTLSVTRELNCVFPLIFSLEIMGIIQTYHQRGINGFDAAGKTVCNLCPRMCCQGRRSRDVYLTGKHQKAHLTETEIMPD